MKETSCYYLRHAIAFQGDEIVVCCHSMIRVMEYYSLLKNFNGEKINWKELNEKRMNGLEDLRNNTPNKYCKNCPQISDDFWGSIDDCKPYINNITISHWTHCNCNCIYCGLDKKAKKKQFKILPVLKEMKKQDILKFDGYLLFGGGEPTCLKELPDILNFFYKNNIKNVQINSSGIDFNRTIAKYISREGTRLTISPDSYDRESYLKIKRVDKFEQVWENIKKYVKAQKNNIYGVRTKYILLQGINSTKEQIYKWLLLSKNAGINCVIMEIESSWYAKIQNNIPEDIVELFNYFEEKAEELGMNTDYYTIGEFIKPLMNKYKNTNL